MSDKRTYKSHKEHGEDMTYESEVKHKMDDRGNLDLTKQIDTLKAEKVALYEKVKNLQNLEEGHQKLNGELRLEVVNLKEELEKYKKDQDIKNDQHTIEVLQKDNEIGRLMKKLQDKK
jgi:predicted  nucleic acid-binding Zn-ribbon protein|tara:strand:+ start:564 stop:917 length:354 start_codon:yes stop_codon:yes gene_type:complete